MPFEQKTKSDRVKEIIELHHTLRRCGFPNDVEGIIKLKEICSQWVKDGKYTKGRIRLPGWERRIDFELYNRKGLEIAVNLIFVKGL